MQALFIPFGCPTDLGEKALLSLHSKYREIKPEMIWEIPLAWLDFTALEAAMQLTERRETSLELFSWASYML